MKTILLSLFLAVVLPQSVFSQSTTERRDTKGSKEVLSVINQLTDAGLKRDVAVLERLYSDDYFHTNPDGSIMRRPDVIASYKAPPKATIDSSEHDEDILQIFRGAALVNSRVTIKGKLGDQPFTRFYRITWVLRKSHGNWQVTNSHATLILQ